MNDVVAVDLVKTIQYLLKVEPDLVLREVFPFLSFIFDHMRQVFLVTELHYHSYFVLKSVKLLVLNDILALASTHEAYLIMNNFQKGFAIRAEDFTSVKLFFIN